MSCLPGGVLPFFTHCSKTPFDGTRHEQTIICRQLFAGHELGCPAMEGKKKLYQMIIKVMLHTTETEGIIGIVLRNLQLMPEKMC